LPEANTMASALANVSHLPSSSMLMSTVRSTRDYWLDRNGIVDTEQRDAVHAEAERRHEVRRRRDALRQAQRTPAWRRHWQLRCMAGSRLAMAAGAAPHRDWWAGQWRMHRRWLREIAA
jgi:hypothetical protein